MIEVPPMSFVRDDTSLLLIPLHQSCATSRRSAPTHHWMGPPHPNQPSPLQPCIAICRWNVPVRPAGICSMRRRNGLRPWHWIVHSGLLYFDDVKIGRCVLGRPSLLVQACDQELNPEHVVCNFEIGLMNAVQTQFPEATVVGCLFHFEQAVSRRMRKLPIPAREVALAMAPGSLDMLTVVDPHHIESHGIAWVKRHMRSQCQEQRIPYPSRKWRVFWTYFRSTWPVRYLPHVWNVHILTTTSWHANNPLERLNRELNGAFPTPRPSLPMFVGPSTISRNSM